VLETVAAVPGMVGAPVLTGATSRNEVQASSITPTYVIEKLLDILPPSQGEHR
jgi:hypothetical protein